jgi:hypothetical protein
MSEIRVDADRIGRTDAMGHSETNRGYAPTLTWRKGSTP